jgi:hypothetical protein
VPLSRKLHVPRQSALAKCNWTGERIRLSKAATFVKTASRRAHPSPPRFPLDQNDLDLASAWPEKNLSIGSNYANLAPFNFAARHPSNFSLFELLKIHPLQSVQVTFIHKIKWRPALWAGAVYERAAAAAELNLFFLQSGPDANIVTSTYPKDKHFNNDLEKAGIDEKTGHGTAVCFSSLRAVEPMWLPS